MFANIQDKVTVILNKVLRAHCNLMPSSYMYVHNGFIRVLLISNKFDVVMISLY